MKKSILLTLCFCLIALPAFGISSHTPGSPETLISGAKVVGSGSTEILVDINRPNHIFEVVLVDANASVTVLTICLEGSFDGANWHTIDDSEFTFTAGELTALRGSFRVLNRGVHAVRGKIVTLTGGDGSNDTVSIVNYDQYRD